MPIRPFLASHAFEPETIRIMALAYQDVCEALGLWPFANDPATRLVAEKIIELTQRGAHDPDALRDMALKEFFR